MPGPRIKPLPPPAPKQPRRLVPLGGRSHRACPGENKPIFLSIGYSACHWCHVMEHESFENAEIAGHLNEHFVSIKVDREERPDLDQIYMNAVQIMTGRGGWPMSVFLTPELKPFYGGTYWPPAPRMGMPGFDQVLAAVNDAWRNRARVRAPASRRVAGHVQAIGGEETDEPGTSRCRQPDSACWRSDAQLAARRESRVAPRGGRAGAERFVRSPTGRVWPSTKIPPWHGLAVAAQAVDATAARIAAAHGDAHAGSMAAGGIYDHLAGGLPAIASMSAAACRTSKKCCTTMAL